MVLRTLKRGIVATIVSIGVLSAAKAQQNSTLRPEVVAANRLAEEISGAADRDKQLREIFAIGAAHEQKSEIPSAASCYYNYIDLLKKHLKTHFMALDAYERESYWSKYLPGIRHIQSFAITNALQNEGLGALAYDCELLSKSLLLEASNRVERAVIQCGDSTIQKQWEESKRLRRLISEHDALMDLLEADSTYMAALKAVADGQTHQLSEEIKEIDRMQLNMQKVREQVAQGDAIINSLTFTHANDQLSFAATWKNIRDTLQQRQAAMELVSSENADGTFYSALLIRPGYDHPLVIPIANESRLIALATQSTLNLDALYSMVWAPLETHLQGIGEIYLSTSGILNTVPFAALKHGGKYLMDQYVIHNLLSTRDIVTLKENLRDHSSKNAILVGGADFGLSVDKLSRSEEPVDEDNLTRGVLDEMDGDRGQGFDYLPGSKTEVTTAAGILSANGWQPAILTDQIATESNLKNRIAEASPTILHISTHGFYFHQPAKEVRDIKMADIGSVDRVIFRMSDDPLMRCGLLFSGANYVWSGNEAPEGAREDGILTGIELSKLNLSATQLAVISSCNSGLGDIDYAEGVYGIQRALRMAGADAMIVSLWKVPDKETVLFMREFYHVLVGNNFISAFRQAQKHMRTLYPDDSEKWAGFVLIE